MNIQFETSNLTPDEALGLIALLETLLPEGYIVDSDNNLTPQGAEAVPVVQHTPAQITTIPSDAPTPIDQPTNDQPAKRTRRTKAEIAADEAAKAASNPTQAAAPGAELQVAGESAKTTDVSPSVDDAPVSPLTAAKLRSLLNEFIAKHSMEDAIGKLKEFGCNRVSEALSLEPGLLNKLVEALRG